MVEWRFTPSTQFSELIVKTHCPVINGVILRCSHYLFGTKLLIILQRVMVDETLVKYSRSNYFLFHNNDYSAYQFPDIGPKVVLAIISIIVVESFVQLECQLWLEMCV